MKRFFFGIYVLISFAKSHCEGPRFRQKWACLSTNFQLLPSRLLVNCHQMQLYFRSIWCKQTSVLWGEVWKAGGCSGVECDRVGRGDICPIGLYIQPGFNVILIFVARKGPCFILDFLKNLNKIFNIYEHFDSIIHAYAKEAWIFVLQKISCCMNHRLKAEFCIIAFSQTECI